MKKITVCIPCFNEKNTIDELLHKVSEVKLNDISKEIIVVDDASSDGTREILKKWQKAGKIKAFYNERNHGKGYCLRKAFGESKGEIVIIQDADLEYDPNDYGVLLEPIMSGKADVVYGSRFMGGKPHRVVYYWHSVVNNFLTTFSNMLTNINLTDMETCYKVMRGDIAREVAKTIKSDRFGFEPEITAKLAKIEGIRFYEVGISYYGRTYKEGKHIKWSDGLRAIWEIIRFNLGN